MDWLLTTTRSNRKTLDLERPVEPEVIEECLRIALQAPTAHNDQRWHFIVVTDPEKRARIADVYARVWEQMTRGERRKVRRFKGANQDYDRVQDSANWLPQHLAEVPVHVIPCMVGPRHNNEMVVREWTRYMQQNGAGGGDDRAAVPDVAGRRVLRLDLPGGVVVPARAAQPRPRVGADRRPPGGGEARRQGARAAGVRGADLSRAGRVRHQDDVPAGEAGTAGDAHVLEPLAGHAMSERTRPRGHLAGGLMFPGQGTQRIGMGRWMERSSRASSVVFDVATEVLGRDVRALCFSGPARELTLTQHAQVAVFTCNAAAAALLDAEGFGAELAVGHSVGELNALVAAGVLTLEDGLRLVAARGELMGRITAPGTMSAVIGLAPDAVRALCEAASGDGGTVVPALLNGPHNVVVSGDVAAVERCEAMAPDAGARKVTRLVVSSAFHSPLMAEAVARVVRDRRRGAARRAADPRRPQHHRGGRDRGGRHRARRSSTSSPARSGGWRTCAPRSPPVPGRSWRRATARC